MAFLRYSSIYCITTKEISISERSVFSSICISTATISSFGAIVQIVNWYKKLQFSESRRILGPSPGVLFSLALADLFTCVGAIAMSILFLIFEPAQKTNDGKHFHPAEDYYVWIGLPIESFTMFSYIASYLWTLFYSFDVCLRAHDLQSRHKIYHVLSWPTAAWLVACAQFAIYSSDTKNCSLPGPMALLHYLVCYIPLSVVMVCLPIVYWKAYRKVSQNITHMTGFFTDAERRVQKSVRKKFCYIIVVFMFCWLPNFIDGFHDIKEYIVRKDRNFFRGADHPFLWFVEASVNPLQGFLNCLVYGQHGQFASCFGHIWSHFQTTYALNDDHQEERSTWTANSLSGSSKIPVSEISPLLAGSRRSTPVLSTPLSDNSSPREPFHAKLLGEFSHS